MTFLYGKDFVSRFGWTVRDVESKVGFLAVVCLVLWMVLVGGNYAVIRDSISLLPVIVAAVLFVSVAFITSWLKKLNYMEKMYSKKSRLLVVCIFFVLAGFSAMPTIWGILLQLSAVLCGMIVGDRLNKNVSDFLVSTFVLGVTTVLLLMQPEYFRFGQLGNLTFIHIAALLLAGFFCVTALATKYTDARAKIYKSAYVKLKWLFRIMSLLALILFVLTESVPVFVGLMTVCALSEMLTIYHSNSFPEYIAKQCWAWLLISFGVMIICPFVTMLGIIYLTCLPQKTDVKDFIKLL